MANQKEVRGVQRSRYLWSVMVVTISFVASIATAYLLPRKPSAIEQAIEAKLADLRARGVPLTPAEVANVLPDPDVDHDARNVLAKALELASTETDPTDLPLLGDGQLPKRGEAIPDPVMNAMRRHLTDGAVMKAVPECLDGVRFSLKWNSGCSNPPVWPRIFEIRALIQTLMLQAVYDAENNNVSGASEALRKGFEVAWTVNDDDVGMAMMRVACARAMCDATEQVLNRARLPVAELMQLEHRIEPELVGDFKNAFMSLRCTGVLHLDEYRVHRKHERDRGIRTVLEDLVLLVRREKRPVYRDEDYLIFLQNIDAREVMLSLPLARLLKRNGELETEYWNQVKGKEAVSMIGSYSLAIPFEAKARLIALKTALAVERYRSANSGAPPTSLDILVPHYMSTAPVDPFDEQPIRYQQRPTGFLVYSVGVDGKDDGGRAPTQLSEPQGYDATVIVER